jgi:ABC-type lipoprotein release transport system permease subunit
MQILANIVLYGFLLFMVYDSIFIEPDYWMTFTVVFLILVAVVTTLMPGLHAAKPSPGEYPYDD